MAQDTPVTYAYCCSRYTVYVSTRLANYVLLVMSTVVVTYSSIPGPRFKALSLSLCYCPASQILRVHGMV
jgi:hypothetical protein